MVVKQPKIFFTKVKTKRIRKPIMYKQTHVSQWGIHTYSKRVGYVVMWFEANHIPRLADRQGVYPVMDINDTILGP